MTLNKSLFVCLDLYVASGACGSERAAGADQPPTVLPCHQNRLITVGGSIPTHLSDFHTADNEDTFFFRIRSTGRGEGAEA